MTKAVKACGFFCQTSHIACLMRENSVPDTAAPRITTNDACLQLLSTIRWNRASLPRQAGQQEVDSGYYIHLDT
ncbi:hypothetical protein JK222_04695 [Gluconobacter cerinus]|uniref:hypothetical protein n=1 Tax=Gluconobacter cerinus TaxID=38307 RepID=UPI001B8CB5BB|nr:hypothetical protein [Gluconobacter cerinus]MBS1071004.1 hypothetical protein [Gluconobacter cerinus]